MQYQPNLATERPELFGLIHNFYVSMGKNDLGRFFGSLSPNLRELIQLEHNVERYESAVKFGRRIPWANLFSVAEIAPGQLDSIVVVCVLSEDAKPAPRGKHRKSDERYSAFKFRLIQIGDEWLIDEITPYKEFWGNEFKQMSAGEESQ